MSENDVTYAFKARLKGASVETTLRSQVALVAEIQAALELGDMFRVVCRRERSSVALESLWVIVWKDGPAQHRFAGKIYHPDARTLGFDTVSGLVEVRMKKQPLQAATGPDWGGCIVDARRLLLQAYAIVHALPWSVDRHNFQAGAEAWLTHVEQHIGKDAP